MKNFHQKGDRIVVDAPAGGALSGDGVLVGAVFGVAEHHADEGAPLVLVLVGVFDLPKTEAQAWTQCAPVYWDADAKVCTTAAAAGPLIGVAWEAAADPSPSGLVRLNSAFGAISDDQTGGGGGGGEG